MAGEKWLDFTAADKGKGLWALCEALEVGLDQVLAVGDNYNDVPMLELAGELWIMEGADPDLQCRFPRHCAWVEDVLEQIEQRPES